MHMLSGDEAISVYWMFIASLSLASLFTQIGVRVVLKEVFSTIFVALCLSVKCIISSSESDIFSKNGTLLYLHCCVHTFEFQNGSLPIRPLGRCASRLVSKRSSHTQCRRTLLVRAVDDDETSEADTRRLEELEARLGVNRKSRREGGGAQSSSPPPKPAAPAKAWDDMTFREKALELYVGEKGALFWLNKAAYASIYIIIGGWIIFRFIGPALGWYELSSPLLPPDQVISGTVGR